MIAIGRPQRGWWVPLQTLDGPTEAVGEREQGGLAHSPGPFGRRGGALLIDSGRRRAPRVHRDVDHDPRSESQASRQQATRQIERHAIEMHAAQLTERRIDVSDERQRGEEMLAELPVSTHGSSGDKRPNDNVSMNTGRVPTN